MAVHPPPAIRLSQDSRLARLPITRSSTVLCAYPPAPAVRLQALFAPDRAPRMSRRAVGFLATVSGKFRAGFADYPDRGRARLPEGGTCMKWSLVALVAVLASSGCLSPVTNRLDLLNEQIATTNQKLDLLNDQMADSNKQLVLLNGQIATTNKELVLLNGQIATTNKQLVLMNGKLDTTNETLGSMD